MNFIGNGSCRNRKSHHRLVATCYLTRFLLICKCIQDLGIKPKAPPGIAFQALVQWVGCVGRTWLQGLGESCPPLESFSYHYTGWEAGYDIYYHSKRVNSISRVNYWLWIPNIPYLNLLIRDFFAGIKGKRCLFVIYFTYLQARITSMEKETYFTPVYKNQVGYR